MRSIVIDELSSPDVDRLSGHLDQTLTPSGLSGVYWLELPENLLRPLQQEHRQSCGPHRVAVVVEEGCLRLELLVRPQESLRCECAAYASSAQRDFLLDYLDRLIKELGLRT